MANNRMQIYCKKCLAVIYIAKYYPVCWYCNGEDKDNGKYLNEFLTKHSSECFENDENADRQWGENMFGFRTEQSDDEFMEIQCCECGKWRLMRKDNFLTHEEKEKFLKEKYPPVNINRSKTLADIIIEVELPLDKKNK